MYKNTEYGYTYIITVFITMGNPICTDGWQLHQCTLTIKITTRMDRDNHATTIGAAYKST